MMIYAILQDKYNRTKHDVHISWYSSFRLDNIIVNIAKSISNDDEMFWRL